MEQLDTRLRNDVQGYDPLALQRVEPTRRWHIRRVMKRLEQISRCTQTPGGITRPYLSDAHRLAAQQIAAWMTRDGLVASIDAVGNVVGNYAGTDRSPRTLIIGASLDAGLNTTPLQGGLGIVLALEAVARLAKDRIRYPFAIEVIAFGGREANRFPGDLIGSRAVAGALEVSAFDLEDGTGTSLRTALQRFGCDVGAVKSLARRPEHILGYLEVDADEGLCLDAQSLPVGVVTSIRGFNRFTVTVSTPSGPGALPTARRRDPLCGAAEMILAVEEFVRRKPGLAAKIGRIQAEAARTPASLDQAEFSLELSSAADRLRRDAVIQLTKQLKDIARRRNLKVGIAETFEQRAIPCAAALTRALSDSIDQCGYRLASLPGATRLDAVAMASAFPVGVLSVRNRAAAHGDLQRMVAPDGLEIATEVLLDSLDRIGRIEHRSAA